MCVVIFGAAGQDGFYLNEVLKGRGYQTILISRSNGNWIKGDVSNLEFVESIVKKHKPETIFHLAANSSTRHEILFENHETISTGSLNILESVYRHSLATKVFLSGSALQFLNEGKPISEHQPFEPSSPYSVARIQSVYAARYYRRLGLKVYVGYLFNHDSPLRSERHVNQKIVMAARRIANGSKEKLELGDISIRKEFSFAGDVVEAMIKLVESDNTYEAVIGSGKDYTIEDWLDVCFEYFNIDWRPVVSVNSFRKEYDRLVSNPETIFKLGWKPRIDFHQLAELMLKAN